MKLSSKTILLEFNYTTKIIELFMEYYPRKLEKEVEKWINREEAIIIRGPRQVGKTTLMKHICEKLGASYVSFDDKSLVEQFESFPEEFVKRFGKTIFIDEAQYSKEIGRIVKMLYDKYKIKFFISGSGSFDIKIPISAYLVGRSVNFELFPLDFEEFVMWKAKDLYPFLKNAKEEFFEFLFNNKKIGEIPFKKEFEELLREFLIFGGFPKVVKENDYEIKKRYLIEIIRSYIEKDIAFFFNIREIESFSNLLKYFANSIGNIIEFSSISSDLKISFKTLKNYVSVLSSTYILNLVNPFYKNLVTELKKAKKAYLIDNGLRNAIIGNFLELEKRDENEIGKLLENFVFNEIKINLTKEIKYWRTTGKAEVDFVINLNNQLIPIEVKTSPKISRGFISFVKTYKPKVVLIINLREQKVKEINKPKVVFIYPFYI